MSFTNAGPSTTSTNVQLGQGTAADGRIVGDASTDKVGFWGATPVAQPAGSGQTEITDNSGGTAAASTGVSANAQKETIIIDVGLLSGLANSQVWKVGLPYAFTVTSALFRTGVAASTAAKAATLTVQVNGSAVTGGVMSLTTANQNATGGTVAASAITAGNTGTAGQTVEVAVSSVTAFAEGSGWVELTVTNTDKANQAATLANLENSIRSALVTAGLIAGS